MINYKKKYLKYKLKYLNLKKIYGGYDNEPDEDDTLEADLIQILKQVEESVRKGDDPIEANQIRKENSEENSDNRLLGDDLDFEEVEYPEDFEAYDISADVENNAEKINLNRNNITLNRNNITVNKRNIERLFHVCKFQQKKLIEISKELHALYNIHKFKLFNEWKDNYKKKLGEIVKAKEERSKKTGTGGP